ncbi:transcription factor TFIIIC subunit tfc4 [Knufia obscura]|uniref:Transcription factor TFIIIC subunit tfc4 n=1 Tax=Knufia obscura TaxID=1635080 RepID=A0ABR0RVS2_9EURO|nr:transcription factor TFIIIC subunit tfc4 [Knufia obscura]
MDRDMNRDQSHDRHTGNGNGNGNDTGNHHALPPPPAAAPGWLSHIPALRPDQIPRAPASFLYDTPTRDGTPTPLSSSPAFNLYLLNHHPAYAPPPTFAEVQRAQLRSATSVSRSPSEQPALSTEQVTQTPPASENGHSTGVAHVQSWGTSQNSPPRLQSPPTQQSLPSQIHYFDDAKNASPWANGFHAQRLPMVPQDVQFEDDPPVSQGYGVSTTQDLNLLDNTGQYQPVFHAPPMHHQIPPNHMGTQVGSDADETEAEEVPGVQWPGRGRKRTAAAAMSSLEDTLQPEKRRRTKGERPRGRRKGEIRGPRTTIDPGEDFVRVYNEALDAFIEKREIAKAQRLVLQAIGLNPEIFAAHSLLADIHFANKEFDSGMDALIVGLHGHLNDVELWRTVADRILNVSDESYQKRVERAMYCFGAIIRKDPTDTDARFQRAECARMLGLWNKAFRDFGFLLQGDPHNSSILAQFAKLCQDLGDVAKARVVYEDHFDYYKNAGITEEDHYTWQDIGIYIDLLVQADETAHAIVMLKRLSRLLCGRGDEYYWEEYIEDDREFDQNHYPRRLQEIRFEPNRYPEHTYGEELPLDLRGKLGILRLKLNNREEAQSHFDWLEPDLEGEESLVEEYNDTFYEIAKALHDAKEHEQALHFYSALDNADIDLGLEFWLDMAASCYICGQKDKAVKCYERVLELNQDSIEARTQLCKLYRDLGSREMAIKYGNEAVVMSQGMIPQTMNRKYERRENRVVREAAERALKAAFKMPKGRSKAPGKVPDDLKYTRGPRLKRVKRFVKYVPRPLTEEPESASPEPRPSKSAQPELVPQSATPEIEEEPPMYSRPIKVPKKPGRPRKPEKEKTKRKAPNQENAVKHYEEMQQLYKTLLNHQAGMREGDEISTNVWIDCAAAMVEDFRTVKPFYPLERHKKFEGYTSRVPQPRPSTPAVGLSDDPTDARSPSSRPQSMRPSPLPNAINHVRIAPHGLPDEYCDIPFAAWLDIFLELALLYANSSNADAQTDCYTAINAAIDCNVFYHHQQSMLTIHSCYLACTLAIGDDLTLYNTVLRWFMREFAFCTDTYRLYGAINLLNELPNVAGGKAGQMEGAIFKSGPNQKFIFRQLMSIDKMLPENYNKDGPEGGVPPFMRRHREELRKMAKQAPANKGTPDTPIPTNHNGVEDAPEPNHLATGSPGRRERLANTAAVKAYSPTEMDVVLFVLYAHIMMSSGSFPNALSYLYRAYSLDPNNTVVLLSLAFCYLHELFKRQTGNRHSYALMGWTWFGRYEEERMKWAEGVDRKADEARGRGQEVYSSVRMVDLIKREVEYNKARCWEMLGMADLGMRGYRKVLDMADRVKDEAGEVEEKDAEQQECEEYTMEAAYAMSTLYALNGNGEKAREITEKYLVV